MAEEFPLHLSALSTEVQNNGKTGMKLTHFSFSRPAEASSYVLEKPNNKS